MMETIKKERYIEMKMLMHISMNTLMHISRCILLKMMLRGKVCNARLDCYVVFEEKVGITVCSKEGQWCKTESESLMRLLLGCGTILGQVL